MLTKAELLKALESVPDDTPVMLLTARGQSLPLRRATPYQGKRGIKILMVP